MKKKKPEIRFNGFEGEWVTTTLGECFLERVERSAEGELISVTISQGVVRASDLDRIDNSSNDKSNYKVVEVGDIAYNSMRMWQGACGYSLYKGICSPAYTVVIPQNNIDVVYCFYLFKRNETLQLFRVNSQGLTSDTWNLKYPAFSQIKCSFPSHSEQEKIGLFLTTLDKLIAKLEAKLDKLRKLKQALLEKMFVNVNGGGYETQEIRFKGYTDKWQVKELREVATKHSMSNQHVHHQNLLSLSYGKIKRKDINSDKGLLPASFDTYQMVKEGVVVMRFTDLQNDKKSLRVGLAKEEGIISPAYVCIYGKESINADFLYQELHYYDSILKLFYSMGDGMRQTLSYTDITTIPISTPQMEEQKKIVDLYDTLDRKITQISTKLTKLRNIKQSLLQKMFA